MNNLVFSNLRIISLGQIEYASILLLTIALIYSVYAIYKRLSKVSKWRKYSLLALHLFAFMAIIGLILQPQYQSSEPLKVRLVTNSSLEALENTHIPSYLLLNESNKFSLSDGLSRGNYRNKILHVADQFLLKHPKVDEIEVIGDGLTESQWHNFPNVKIDYQVPELKEGIIYPSWNSSLNLGDTLNFIGRFQSTSKKASKGVYTARLLNPADDVVAEANIRANQLFKLSAQPKLAGQHQYKLQITDSNRNVIAEENLNVRVSENSSAKILVVQSSPSFETKQLQNWAAENGSQFLVRTQISKDHFTTRSTNIPENSIKGDFNNKLNREIFDQFDLVIIDGRGLVTMSANEQNDLLLSVNNGLGLIVLVDQVLLNINKNDRPELSKGFQLTSLQQELEVIPYLVNDNLSRKAISDNFIPLAAQAITSSSDKVELLSLIETSKGHMIVAQQSMNLGNIAVSLLQETHRLVTSGERTNYSELWQHLIKSTARKALQAQLYIDNNSQLLFESQLTRICYYNLDSQISGKLLVIHESSREDSPKNSAQEIQLQANSLLKNQYCGYFWPRQSGWYIASFTDNMSLTEQFYVSEKNKWQAYQQKKRIKATLTKRVNFVQTSENIVHYKEINLWFFWWMFFISASLIWTERKFL